MLKPHKKAICFTSFLTLLPGLVGLILWDRFPTAIATHYGFTGTPDGWSGVPMTVFGMPVLMLALHWLCILLTARDPGNRNQNRKIFHLFLWIIPITSNLCCFSMYALALGKDFNITFWTVAGIGVLFAAIGNYLPKTRMNSTIGIKISWAYTSDDNWTATHRFAGKLWFVGGIALIFLAFLPEGAAIIALFVVILVLSILPMVYSWRYWNVQKARGDELKPVKNAHPATHKYIVVTLILTLIFVAFALFCGSLKFTFQKDALLVDASCYSDYRISYSEIQDVSFRVTPVDGWRVGGFSNFRLELGYFKNDEFGTYIRYTYYNPDACIVLTLPSRTLVLSGRTAEETQSLYQALLEAMS